MTSVTNLFRDQVYVNPGILQPGFSSQIVIGSSANMMSSGVVQQSQASAVNHRIGVASTSGNSWRASGLLISQPVIDSTPYRVKAYVATANGNGYVFVGYAPASPTGNDDLITNVTAFPVTVEAQVEAGIFDEVLYIPGLPQGDPNFDKPLAFGIAVEAPVGTTIVRYNLSVQNMAKTAPQFAASMS